MTFCKSKKQFFLIVFILYLSIFFLIGNTFSADWKIVRQNELNADFNDVYFINENVGWIVGNNATIAHTEDGGTTWIKQNANLDKTYNFTRAYFSDAQKGWVIGGPVGVGVRVSSIILHTEDNGMTWRHQRRIDLEYLEDIDFVNTDDGWVAGFAYDENRNKMSGIILRTSDSGNNWKIQLKTDDITFSGVDFVNSMEGWTIGYSNVENKDIIFHTFDGGNTWKEQASFPGVGIYDLYFVDSKSGWLVGNTILHTNDGGVTWKPQTDGINEANENNILVNWILKKVYFLNNKQGWIACNRGKAYLLYTKDGGNTWGRVDRENLNINTRLNSVYFVNPSLGWAVGDHAGLLRTTDGVAWKLQIELSGDLSDVDFVDSKNGWAVGDWNILHTQDGGETWTDQLKDDKMGWFENVDFVDSENGWILTQYSIFHTKDGGNSLSEERPPINGDQEFYATKFLSQTDGWLVGRDRFLITNDGGKTWLDRSPKMRVYIKGLNPVSLQEGWIVGSILEGMTSVAASLYTKDGGKNWEITRILGVESLLDVDFVSPKKGWAVGREDSLLDTGIILYTDDGGEKWQVQYNSKHELTSVCFISENEGWAVGSNGTILHTQNGGEDWKLQDSNVNNHFAEVCYDDDSSIYVVGQYGIILRLFDPAFLSSHAVESKDKIAAIWGTLKGGRYKDNLAFILCQNYPNPCNPETWIPFQLSEDTDVMIRIHDSSGRLIKTLVLGHKSAGFYASKDRSAYWDGKNENGEQVASGIYFYTIQAGKYTATSKMLMLK